MSKRRLLAKKKADPTLTESLYTERVHTVHRYLLGFIASLCLTSCATLTRGTTQTVAVNTPGVPAAICTLTSPSVGSQTITTPGVVTLAKGSSAVSIRCTKECYSDGAGVLSSSMDGMTAGNVVVGGVVGLGVDAATGAMNQYAPQADIVMTQDGSCPAPSLPKRRS